VVGASRGGFERRKVVKPVVSLARSAIGRILPDRAYRRKQVRWDRKWAKANFSPRWRVRSIPPEIRDAVESGWFRPGTSLLDIGCGGGEVAAWLASQGFEVTGVDYSRPAIARAKAAYPSVGGLRFETLDICRRAPGRSRFEGLVDRGCLHVVPTRARPGYARNVAATAQPGARFLLLHHLLDQERADTIREYEELFLPAFDIVRISDHVFERSGKSHDSNVNGLACWMVRRERL
jgi:SAM-dependent methyltransferase